MSIFTMRIRMTEIQTVLETLVVRKIILCVYVINNIVNPNAGTQGPTRRMRYLQDVRLTQTASGILVSDESSCFSDKLDSSCQNHLLLLT